MAEYSQTYTLTTPAGDVAFNPAAGGDGLYLTDPPIGLDGGAVRAVVNDIPQDAGSLLGPFFRSGIKTTLKGVILAEAGTTARRQLEDKLRGYTNGLLAPTAAQLVASCRLRWVPSGASDARMLDGVQLMQEVAITGGYIKTFELTLVSPYPYVQAYTQTSTPIASGGSATLTNLGDATVRPVIQLTGPVGAGAYVVNTTTGEKLQFLAGAASGGHYIEADCFKRTAYLDGNGADKTGAIDWTVSDYLTLVSGANALQTSGVAVTVLWNSGWVG